jgi:hypothetical protein
MIEPLPPSDAMVSDWIVADIENRSDGTLLSIDTYDGVSHYEHESWESWYNFVSSRAEKHKEWRTIYAHNGGGWDWLSCVEHLADTDLSFWTVQNDNHIIVVQIPVKKGVTLRLCDSLGLLKVSLASAAETFCPTRRKIKLTHLPEWYYENDKSKYTQYHRNDTETLYEVIARFSATLRMIAPIQSLGVTLPATAMRIFRTGYLRRNISIPSDHWLRSFLRNGYNGGRVEVFRPGYHRRIYVYDFNSLYPSVMRDTHVPVSGSVQHTDTFDPEKCGCYRIRFTQHDCSRPPVLLCNGVGVYSGYGVYFSPELRRLATVGEFTVTTGVVFCAEDLLFRDYVDTLYRLRMTDAQGRDGPLGTTCKYLMNTLYGKFGQKTERSRTQKMTYDEMVDARDSGRVVVDILHDERGIYRLTSECDVSYEHVGIAGIITSEARARLWESMDANTVYCDTDSIHSTTPRHDVSQDIGKLKLEFSGEGVYCGKKLYALRCGDKVKVRAKGVRVRRSKDDDLGCRIGFDDLRAILGGGKLVCQFRNAATANEVFRARQHSCTMVTRRRTLRVTTNGSGSDTTPCVANGGIRTRRK